MFHELLSDARFWQTLISIDEELCDETRAAGCQRCEGRLDRADYPRKPRGLPEGVDGFETRFSLCCDDCRTRVTPPSVRFLGRRVYVGALVLLAALMRLAGVVVRELRARYGARRRTLERWARWWREHFPTTRLWRAGRARFATPVDEATLPRSLLGRFAGDDRGRVVAALRFLLPLTTTSVPDI